MTPPTSKSLFGSQFRPRGKAKKKVHWHHHSGYAMVGMRPVFIELVPETDSTPAGPWGVPRAKPTRGPWLAAIYSDRFKERMMPLGERLLAEAEGATLVKVRAATVAQLEQLESGDSDVVGQTSAPASFTHLGSG